MGIFVIQGISTIRPFSKSRDVEIRKIPKVYLCDSGLVNQLARVARGQMFEQAVFQTLRRKGELNYYRKKSGAEIDFILDKKAAYEVKIAPDAHDLKRLRALAKELKLKKAHIVSKERAEVPGLVYGFQL